MRPLALKGRQITDGGKQRAAPGRGKLITPPLPAPMAQGRGKGEGVAVDRGLRFAHPRLYSAAPSGLLWQCKRKSVILGERICKS